MFSKIIVLHDKASCLIFHIVYLGCGEKMKVVSCKPMTQIGDNVLTSEDVGVDGNILLVCF